MTIAWVRCAARGWYCSRVPGVQSSEKSQTSARILVRRRVPRLGLRVAISPEQRQLPVPGQRDLRARVTAFLDMLPDQPVEMLQRGRGKAEARRVGGWQRVVVEHGCLLPGVQSQDA